MRAALLGVVLAVTLIGCASAPVTAGSGATSTSASGAATGAMAAGQDPAVVAEIREVVDRLFTGMRTGDTAMMTSAIDVDARMVSASMRGGVPVANVGNVRAWLSGVANAREVLNERIWDVEIRIDGTLATAWMQYDFHVGERFSHCGVNAMQLVRTASGWKIVNVADSRRTECATRGR
jgi:hypothetical protein